MEEYNAAQLAADAGEQQLYKLLEDRAIDLIRFWKKWFRQSAQVPPRKGADRIEVLSNWEMRPSVTKSDAAWIFGVDRKTIDRWVCDGILIEAQIKGRITTDSIREANRPKKPKK
jgi:hypothetical protein